MSRRCSGAGWPGVDESFYVFTAEETGIVGVVTAAAAGQAALPVNAHRASSRAMIGAAIRECWRALTSLREKLIKIGAKIVRHGRYVT
ncbi:MAG: hypothetical protein O2992_10735, partial [Gemmatimonadetes bacterium]|nr:hypothetical protein [Gemmatimonadota bacterium]